MTHDYEHIARGIIHNFWLSQVMRIATEALKEPPGGEAGIRLYPPTKAQIGDAVYLLRGAIEPPTGELMLAVPTEESTGG